MNLHNAVTERPDFVLDYLRARYRTYEWRQAGYGNYEYRVEDRAGALRHNAWLTLRDEALGQIPDRAARWEREGRPARPSV